MKGCATRFHKKRSKCNRNGIKQQILWSKRIAKTYRLAAASNYWNGRSTGVRHGYLLAQELGGELEGVLADAPAIYQVRFHTARIWGQIAVKELTGGPILISAAKTRTDPGLGRCRIRSRRRRGDYAPYFISSFTTGDEDRATSTFCRALSRTVFGSVVGPLRRSRYQRRIKATPTTSNIAPNKRGKSTLCFASPKSPK
jgi:hypothetical protein